MNSLKNSDACELNNGVCVDQIQNELETELNLRLENTQEVRVKLKELQDKLSENKNPEEEKKIQKEIKELSDQQICTDDLFTFFEFAHKYQEYLSDVINRYQNNKSDLITDDNLIYALGLYRKYANDAFDEIIRELNGWDVDIFRIRKHLLSYSKFEKCLYYHAYSLCYNRGIKSPTYDDVNKMISIKPYGDSSLYPQNEIWQIVGYPGDLDRKAYRDYYCELAIRNLEITKKQSEDIANISPVQANNFISET